MVPLEERCVDSIPLSSLIPQIHPAFFHCTLQYPRYEVNFYNIALYSVLTGCWHNNPNKKNLTLVLDPPPLFCRQHPCLWFWSPPYTHLPIATDSGTTYCWWPNNHSPHISTLTKCHTTPPPWQNSRMSLPFYHCVLVHKSPSYQSEKITCRTAWPVINLAGPSPDIFLVVFSTPSLSCSWFQGTVEPSHIPAISSCPIWLEACTQSPIPNKLLEAAVDRNLAMHHF